MADWNQPFDATTMGNSLDLEHCQLLLASPWQATRVSSASQQLAWGRGSVLSKQWPRTVNSVAKLCLTLRPHVLQHTGLPCPSPTPRACSNSCPSSQWCHLQASHSLSSPSSSTFNLSQNQGLFKWVSSSHQVVKLSELQLQHQSFQWIFRMGILYDWLVWSPWSPRDSQESSTTPQFKSISFRVLSFLYDPTLMIQLLWSNSSIHTWLLEKSTLTRWTFFNKVMSLLLIWCLSLSSPFFPRSKHL